MKRINSLNDLLMEELSDLLNAESQLVEALPQMAQVVGSPGLKAALEEYQEISKEHVRRLDEIFDNIGQNPQRVVCRVIKELITGCDVAVNKTEKSPDRDTSIISAAQRMEEYEISKYKTAREHAVDLGHTKIVEVFAKTLNEQRAMNLHFNELAQGMINAQVMEPEGKGFYIPEGKFGRKGVKKKSITDISRFISEGNPNTDGSS